MVFFPGQGQMIGREYKQKRGDGMINCKLIAYLIEVDRSIRMVPIFFIFMLVGYLKEIAHWLLLSIR